MFLFGLLFLGVTVIFAALLARTYNQLVTLRNRFKNAFAQIDVQLQRRNDLIPNMVETARAYMTHERETLEAVIQARNASQVAVKEAAAHPEDATAVKALLGAESALSGAMGRFFALAESYPELKANTNMMQLSEELSSTENRVAFARQAFNDAVTGYNTAREHFPANVVAPFFGFQSAELLQIEDESHRNAPKISFN